MGLGFTVEGYRFRVYGFRGIGLGFTDLEV